MNDDHRDDRNDPHEGPEAGDPAIPAGADSPGSPPPPITPSHDGGAALPPPPSPVTRKPADYYAQPPAAPEPKKGCGKWALGCGIGGCLVGILIIIGFVWIARSGWPMLMSRMVTEVEDHIETNGEEIDPAIREELAIELDELKRHIEDRDISLEDMQGVVYTMRDVVGDDNVTTQEAQDFLDEVREVNEIGASGEF